LSVVTRCGVTSAVSPDYLVVAELGPYDGVWSHPAAWGGDGGWVYIADVGPLRAYSYKVDTSGNPALTLSGTTSDRFGFGSGSPVVTSNGTSSGSAPLWVVYVPDGTGVGAELRSYDPVPENFGLNLRWTATTTPGHLTLSPTTVDFGTVTVGQSVTSSFDIANTGGVAITITLAKAPFGTFSTDTPIAEGTVLSPGEHRIQSVRFAPRSRWRSYRDREWVHCRQLDRRRS
jgi:hypothetical protein